MPAGLAGLDAKGLRLVLGLFLLLLAVPTGVLVFRAYDQLKWETFHQYRTLAEELGARIDLHLSELIAAEEERSFSEYAFLVEDGAPAGGPPRRSPLSQLPVRSDIPGLVGWFQVDPEGVFSTPLLPGLGQAPGMGPEELERRESLAASIRSELTRNRLVGPAPRPKHEPADAAPETAAEEAQIDLDDAAAAGGRPADADKERASVPAQAAFDRLELAEQSATEKRRQAPKSALGRVDDLKLDLSYQRGTPPAAPAHPREAERKRRVESGPLPRPSADGAVAETQGRAKRQTTSAPTVRMFESEVDPFSLSLLDSGQFVLFRKVWRDGRRYIQGALIAQRPFLQGLIEDAFRGTSLSRMSDLAVAYGGEVLAAYGSETGRDYLASAGELTGSLLQRMRLSAPAGDIELIFGIRRLPAGAGASVVGWLAATLAIVLIGGFYLLYRLGLRQIVLARQQQDFISAVSHELKTPLTSIRMYGDMLREGWATEERKRTYYDFICTESERLTRLINNVLQLARLTRSELTVELRPLALGALMDGVRPKLASQAEQAGFRLRTECEEAADTVLSVDEDFLTQILINLVDNALKFSRHSEPKEVVIRCARERSGELSISVRDFGPGIRPDQMKKIFRLFYRAGSELTRETVGTGIGLALVRQLALRMNGRVDVINRAPGAEFQLFLPTDQKRKPA